MKIKIVHSENDNKTVGLISNLSHQDSVDLTVAKYHGSIPIMWIDDDCYTGHEQIKNRLNVIRDEKGLVYDKTLSDLKK